MLVPLCEEGGGVYGRCCQCPGERGESVAGALYIYFKAVIFVTSVTCIQILYIYRYIYIYICEKIEVLLCSMFSMIINFVSTRILIVLFISFRKVPDLTNWYILA